MKTTTRLNLLATLALLLALCLMALAGPASASTTVNTLTWVMMGELDPGDDLPQGDDGTWYGENWVAYSLIYRATGADGWRFLGYGVVCLDIVVPPKGNNYHTGEVVILGAQDPSGFWNADKSFSDNLAGRQLLWTGTWDGFTRNKYNHHALMALTGAPGSVNEGYTACYEAHCGQFNVAWRNPNLFYVDTPWNGVARVTAL
jgi:hypothetical protein